MKLKRSCQTKQLPMYVGIHPPMSGLADLFCLFSEILPFFSVVSSVFLCCFVLLMGAHCSTEFTGAVNGCMPAVALKISKQINQ